MEGLCFSLLLFGFFLQSTDASEIEEDSICGEKILNAGDGEISLSDFYLPENFSCRWFLSAAPRKRILVNVQSVRLLSKNENLIINVDNDSHSLPQECVDCSRLPALVGQIVNVTYTYENIVDSTDDEFVFASNESSSFNVTYRSFDPNKCTNPKVPQNGYYVGKNWTKHSKIYYRCNRPYELLGKDKLTCVVVEGSPVPVWDGDPPQCTIPSCRNGMINRTAGSGTIVHPGYPEKYILNNQHCQWFVKTEKDRRITITIKSFSLPLVKTKHNKVGRYYLEFFDNSTDNLILRLQGQSASKVLTTETNQLMIVLNTGNVSINGNDAGGSYGFNIEYAATCPVLNSPLHGSFKNNDWSVGSNVTVECQKGFDLEGERQIHCLPNASWSSSVPSCRPQPSTVNGVPSSSQPSVNFKVISKFSQGNKKTELLHQSALDKENKEKLVKNVFEKSEKDWIGSVPTEVNGSTSIPSLRHKEGSLENDDTFTIVVIVCGIAIPVVLLLACFSACLWYRKRYPARMGFGRKFETFENPAYQTRKRTQGAADLLENPAELQRLTKLTSP